MTEPAGPPRDASQKAASADASSRLAGGYSEKEQKNLFLYVVITIVLLEFAATVGAIVYSIANAERSDSGMMHFNFPWLGFLVMAMLIPALVMLVLHMVNLGLSHGSGTGSEGLVGGRAATFFALVRGAPSVILFAGFVLMGAAIYYLDGVMALLLKLGDSFETVAVWVIGALAAVFCVNAVARAVFAYKTRQMEEEYAFRREVLEKTGTVLLDARLAPSTELRCLPAAHGGGKDVIEGESLRLDALPEAKLEADSCRGGQEAELAAEQKRKEVQPAEAQKLLPPVGVGKEKSAESEA